MSSARGRSPLLLLVAAAVVLLAKMPGGGLAEAKPKKATKAEARGDEKARPKHSSGGSCRPQKPQSFLVRSTFVVDNHLVPAAHQRAIRYRTEQYGYVEGFGSSKWNAHPPDFYAEQATFFGHSLRVHKRMAPALKCVEEELARACAKSPYAPAAVGGFRDHNSYRGGEVTNHLYGIAIDIDPERNPCCHCVEPWGSHPKCQDRSLTAYERMAMPACWVETFERYGFYWLGHDRLQDTMHFEFLGKPEKITR